MGENSKIEWTDSTWNPIRARNLATGKIGWHCEHVSDGCANCYAEGMNHRLGTGLPFKPGHRKDVEIYLDEKMLLAPLRWKKPRMIFVCSMTDAFADFVRDEWLDRMFAVMALCPQHAFQVLTKRPRRMREYIDTAISRIADAVQPLRTDSRAVGPLPHLDGGERWWPLANVWVGISAEDQATADERIPLLLDTPAAVRFVSLEPLLGPIDLVAGGEVTEIGHINWLSGHKGPEPPIPGLNWVIVGGESGPRARPMHPDWARSLRDQCRAAGVPFFFKQWGEWADAEDWPSEIQEHYEVLGKAEGNNVRVGKKRAGRLLDGVEHNGMPY